MHEAAGARPWRDTTAFGVVVGAGGPWLFALALAATSRPEDLLPGAVLLLWVGVVTARSGRAAGVVASMSSALVLYLVVVPPRWSLEVPSAVRLAGLALFAVAAAATVALVRRVRRAEAEARAAGAAAASAAGAARLGRVLDNMLDAIAILEPALDDRGEVVDFVMTYANAHEVDDEGRDLVELRGLRLLDCYPALRGSAYWDAALRCLGTRERVALEGFEYSRPSREGRRRGLFDVHFAPFEGAVLVVSREITERLERERELAASQRQLRAAQRLARLGGWRLDLDTLEFRASPEFAALVGVAAAELAGPIDAVLARFVHPDDRPMIVGAIDAIRAPGSSSLAIPPTLRGEVRLLVGERVVHGHAYAELERGAERPDGRVLWGTLQDVTEQRQAEEEHARRQATVEVLQRAVLPEHLPETEGAVLDACYQPASAEANVGGDWFDAFALPGGRIALVVGDVAGHGTAAVATMALLRNALRAYAVDTDEPALVVERLSVLACTQPGLYATVVVGVYDPMTRELRWASAGHLPPVVRDASGVRLLDTVPAAPLGIVRARPAEHRVELTPGSVVFFYTDGLVERRDSTIDVGLARLVRALDRPLDAGRDASTQLAERAPGPMHDDVCVLALRLDQSSS